MKRRSSQRGRLHARACVQTSLLKEIDIGQFAQIHAMDSSDFAETTPIEEKRQTNEQGGRANRTAQESLRGCFWLTADVSVELCKWMNSGAGLCAAKAVGIRWDKMAEDGARREIAQGSD